MLPKKFTPKQQAFVEEYLVDLNSTRAAVRAGYSKKTATAIGAENLRKPHINQAILQAKDKRSKRTEVTQDSVMTMLTREALGRGPDTVSSARIRAAELLGKHLGMFVEKGELKVEHDGEVTLKGELDLSNLSMEELANLARLGEKLKGNDEQTD